MGVTFSNCADRSVYCNGGCEKEFYTCGEILCPSDSDGYETCCNACCRGADEKNASEDHQTPTPSSSGDETTTEQEIQTAVLESYLGRSSPARGDEQETEETEEHPLRVNIPPPKLNICMLVIGTWGDVMPFMALGKLFQANGHRVRLASHTCYRGKILNEGLEYYPLAGDPQLLSQWAVDMEGNILPRYVK